MFLLPSVLCVFDICWLGLRSVVVTSRQAGAGARSLRALCWRKCPRQCDLFCERVRTAILGLSARVSKDSPVGSRRENSHRASLR